LMSAPVVIVIAAGLGTGLVAYETASPDLAAFVDNRYGQQIEQRMATAREEMEYSAEQPASFLSTPMCKSLLHPPNAVATPNRATRII
jgi:hypothetical protein